MAGSTTPRAAAQVLRYPACSDLVVFIIATLCLLGDEKRIKNAWQSGVMQPGVGRPNPAAAATATFRCRYGVQLGLAMICRVA